MRLGLDLGLEDDLVELGSTVAFLQAATSWCRFRTRRNEVGALNAEVALNPEAVCFGNLYQLLMACLASELLLEPVSETSGSLVYRTLDAAILLHMVYSYRKLSCEGRNQSHSQTCLRPFGRAKRERNLCLDRSEPSLMRFATDRISVPSNQRTVSFSMSETASLCAEGRDELPTVTIAEIDTDLESGVRRGARTGWLGEISDPECGCGKVCLLLTLSSDNTLDARLG